MAFQSLRKAGILKTLSLALIEPACGVGIVPDTDKAYRSGSGYLQPMSKSTYDVAIVGGGIVGVSIGIALLNSKKNLRVLLVEKEKSQGLHASGRNSGVLHAGFYYSPDSLKAKFCRDGNEQIRTLCKRNNLPILECGKVVVTQDILEEKQLDVLLGRGTANGVALEILEASDLRKYEPLAQTYKRFLWSPNTAVADPGRVIKTLTDEFVRKGGEIQLGRKLKIVRDQDKVKIANAPINAKHVINTAGANADLIAKQIGLAMNYAMIPFAGIYRVVTSEKIPLQRLVYPVPHPINPFLGVHFTKTVDGKTKIGPSAIPIFGREQYRWNQGWNLKDMKEMIVGSYSIAKGKSHSLTSMIGSEWPKFLESRLIRDAAKLVPTAREVNGWTKKPPGIRAQLVELSTGKLEQDFVVESFLNSTHVLNAVSPGWTSAIPFGRYVAGSFVLPRLD
jgi:L-2-hydroxyglutarate oxidase LhgO